jgi:multiple sugar transport system permease protein
MAKARLERRLFGAMLSHAVLAAASLIMLLPFLWMLMVSLAPQGEVYSGALWLRPSIDAARDNYQFALSRAPLLRYMLNGAFVCISILFAQILIAAPAGYALAKLPFRGKPLLMAGVIMGLMIPIQVPAIPLYIALAYAGLLDSYTALILPFVISGFGIFLFRQFFASYPDEVIDAARLDGFSELAILWRLILPAAWPAVAAFAIFSIVAHWNDLYWPLVVLLRPEMMTPPLGLATFRQSGDSAGNVGALMAGGVMITAPLVLLFAFAQKHFIQGMTLSKTSKPPKSSEGTS